MAPKVSPGLLKSLAPDWRTVLSGALIVFAFPPWNVYPLIWFALVPWFGALRRQASGRAAFVQGVWLSVLMSLGGFYWVAHVLQEFGNLPGWLAVLGLVLFSLFGQPQFPLFALLWRWARVSRADSWPRSVGASIALALLVALAYTGIDWILPKLFVDTFGHSLYLARSLRQAADLGGATLLTFVIFLANEAIYWLASEVRARREPSLLPALRKTGGPAGVALAVFVATWAYGHVRYGAIRRLEEHPKDRMEVAVIQANIGDFDKLAAEQGIAGAADRVLKTLFDMTDEALRHQPRPAAVIWPETSYPSTFRTPSNAEEADRDHRVEAFVRSRKVNVLFGGYDHFNDKDYNAFFFLSPDAHPGVDGPGDEQVYRKNMLLLFGEYIPGAETFDFIKNAFPQVGNFGRGAGPSVLTVSNGPGDTVRTGPIICYEALFPNYVIGAARKGSQLILNITNDSWFGESGEPILHLSLTTFRSIETHLPQLRATNTGISALILPDGEITEPTRIGVPEVLYASVPILDPQWTLIKAWGDWFGWFALVVTGLGLGGWELRRRSAGAPEWRSQATSPSVSRR
jgi:apolipoprotein N-acyltransferase